MQNQLFTDFKLDKQIFRAIAVAGYERPTPIQAEAIPHLVEGRDLIGSAQTGTGKTAAFALPIIQRFLVNQHRRQPRTTRALVLAPTRELAAQVGESFRTYGKFASLSCALVNGGVSYGPQIKALSKGVDVLVATPGRLIDLIEKKYVSLSEVEVFVLDEADRMLDMGFMPDIKKIVSMLPQKRQSLLFSATMPPPIMQLAEKMLKEPVKIAMNTQSMTVDNIDDKVIFVDESKKKTLLSEMLMSPQTERVLVFTKTKRGANKLVEHLEHGNVNARAIHGNKTQSARTAALRDFKTGRCRVLVATDVASRGIDVSGITHVINYNLPDEAEVYVHRIGRTARAGASGTAISFCCGSEREMLRNIERLIKRSVPVYSDHSYESAKHVSGETESKPMARKRNRFEHKRSTFFAKKRKFSR